MKWHLKSRSFSGSAWVGSQSCEEERGLTGLPELLLIIMKSFIITHADTVHLDLHFLCDGLLTTFIRRKNSQISDFIQTGRQTDTDSYSCGREILLLVFCSMLAWFLRVMHMTDGASLQGSPSTCTGMGLKVVKVTSWHWWSLSPCPPTCSVAYTKRAETFGWIQG